MADENRETRKVFKLDDNEFEKVNSFVYFGSTINLKGDSTDEIKQRTGIKIKNLEEQSHDHKT